MHDSSLSAARPSLAIPARLLLPLWVATIFLSAFLLFFIQPMFTKMVLPLLGGSPAVWSTSLVFFQATLLAGYLYAHVSANLLSPPRQVILHLVLLAAASFTLPFAVAPDIMPSVEHPIFWLLAFLLGAIGLPFFTLSANAPLLQSWFARSGHPSARDPYFLYAASNLGSMLALLGFPFLFERVFDLHAQSALWTAGFLSLIVLIACCGLAIWRAPPVTRERMAAQAADEPIAWPRRVRWIMLSAVPSSLLLGVTAHLSVDVAAVPLLWVVPLALYLLTFAFVFAVRPPIAHARILQFLPIAAVVLGALFWLRLPLWLEIVLHLSVFFVMAMMCHGELARLRPGASRATEFYLLMSLGGVIGGASTALLAPLVFNSVLEYPIAVVLACWLRPSRQNESQVRALALDIAVPLVLFAATGLGLLGALPETMRANAAFLSLCGLAIAAFAARNRSLRFALCMAALLSFVPGRTVTDLRPLLELRSFFGVHRVVAGEGGAVNLLTHGTTIHGMQYTDPARRCEPAIYYAPQGPFGQALASRKSGLSRGRVGIVGLGAGGAAANKRPGESWTYYEIDPLVKHIATATPHFTYLRDCAPDVRIELGDARLTLRDASPNAFDVLIIDAFSSDAIPIHLLTREAVSLYFDKLESDGVLLMHISNRYLELAPILARIADDLGLEFRLQRYRMATAALTQSDWVVLARAPNDLGEMADDPRWQRAAALPAAPLWTDSFSNILDVLKR
ncbi:MAG TPA: fused MFS/spermidine synthase [Aestuariivirgaceae bacterium]|jgi:hypothetical protein